MDIENKICFFLNWSREIDMYKNTYDNLSKNSFVFVINDLNRKNLAHELEKKKIINFLENNNLKYYFLTKIFRKKKFKLLISTGDLSIPNFNLLHSFKYLYANTVGRVLQFFRLDILSNFYFGKDLSLGGKNTLFFDEKFIEKEISINSVKFPNGLDRNIKFFPNKKWKNVFDIYFTSSLIEKPLIEKKFKDKKFFYIGYPRFNEINIHEQEVIKKEFNFQNKKKTIYCSPTEWLMSNQNIDSINNYLAYLKILGQNYNLIIRPHPKLETTNLNNFNLIKKSGLNIDLNPVRKIQNIFLISDLILTDFGSSLLEAIYLKKKLLIFKWPNEISLIKKYNKFNNLDYLKRKELSSINIFENYNVENFLTHISELIIDKEYQKKIEDMNKELFGIEKNILNSNKIVNNLYAK